MDIEVTSPIEPLDVLVGGARIRIPIDVTAQGQLMIAEKCRAGASKMEALEAMAADASSRGDKAEEQRIRVRMEQAMRETLAPIIGKEAYEAIADAATLGNRELRPLTINTFSQVMGGITSLLAHVQETAAKAIDTAATRDTLEGDVAQPISDEAAV